MKYPERINKIIPRVLRSLKIEERLKNWHAVENWEEIVGKNIAQHARAIRVDMENLFVVVDNPVWQGQLFLMKEKIIKKIRSMGINIKDIKFSIHSVPNKKERL